MFGPETLQGSVGNGYHNGCGGVISLTAWTNALTEGEWTPKTIWLLWFGASVYGVVLAVILFGILPVLSDSLNSVLGPHRFWAQQLSIIVCLKTLFIRIS